MGNAALLLDKAKKHCSPANYSGLAARLDISRAVVSAWKTGDENMPEDRIAQIARIAGEDPGKWLLLIRAEQTTGEVARGWASIAKRYGIAAAMTLCVVGFGSNSPDLLAFGVLPFLPVHIMSIGAVALLALAWWAAHARRPA